MPLQDTISSIKDTQKHRERSVPIEVQTSDNGPYDLYELQYHYGIIIEDVKGDGFSITTVKPGLGQTNHALISSTPQLKNRSLHRHNYIEFMVMLSGNLTQRIEDKYTTYHAGQCCILNRNVCHTEELTEDFQAAFIMVSLDMVKHIISSRRLFDESHQVFDKHNRLSQLLVDSETSKHGRKEYMDFVPLVPYEELKDHLEYIVEGLIKITYHDRPGNFLIFEAALIRLMTFLFDEDMYQCTVKSEKMTNREDIFISITHILEKYHGRVSRQKLESMLNYSGDYLNKIVKANTGLNLNDYGQKFTLREAERLLRFTDMSISEIISELGFSNRSYFYRVFAGKYGMTPVEYRKQL